MSPDSGLRLFIHRKDLHRTHIGPDPDAPGQHPLQDGQARLAVDTFALTSNNITYAAFGEAMKYWQFFPAGDATLGCLPVWGFATVSESRADGLAVGRRIYGYWPAGTHLVVQPTRLNAAGFADARAHRAELAAVYNQYSFCDADPAWRADAQSEGQQAVLRPLFMTSFLIDDFLADNHFFGAKQVLLSSASSKTAFGTAFCLALRAGRGSTGSAGSAGTPAIVGLTSAGNLDFTRALGCYDEVRRYDEVGTLDPTVASVYVDFAGNATLRRAVHERFAQTLAYSSSIGGTHWESLGSGGGLPGPRPTLFFAPAQIKKRSGPPPEGWGREGLQTRMAQAWALFISRINAGSQPWVRIVQRQGGDAVQSSYGALLAGTADARDGLMLRM